MEARVLENIGERRPASRREPPNYTRRIGPRLRGRLRPGHAGRAAVRRAACGPTTLRAVHFVIDTEQAERAARRTGCARPRRVRWTSSTAPTGGWPGPRPSWSAREAEQPGTQVTVILPRRSFSPLLGRLLHDRTADKIAGVVSRIPNAAATIIPFDVQNRLHVLQERQAGADGQPGRPLTPVPGAAQAAGPTARSRPRRPPPRSADRQARPGRCPAPAATTGRSRRPASPRSARSDQPGKATVEGRVRRGRDPPGGAELGAGLRDLPTPPAT